LKRLKKILSYIIIILLVFVYVSMKDGLGEGPVEGSLEIHYIDVGQGDSALIKTNNHYMLIDGGKRSSREVVLKHLENEGVSRLDYIIGTHPHEDHIGGLAHVIEHVEVGEIIMPDVTTTTKTFENLLDTIASKGLNITKAVSGHKYRLDEAEFLILAPNSDSYSNLNNYSVAIKLQFGKTSFLFTGDAEALSEREMVENYKAILKADVLKLGHHGSNTSTTEEFLSAVNPDYAVISVGKNNLYNHPDQDVLDMVEKRGIDIFRTDQNGTIIAESDGEIIKFFNKSVTSSINKLYDLVVDGFKNLGEALVEKYTKTKLELTFI